MNGSGRATRGGDVFRTGRFLAQGFLYNSVRRATRAEGPHGCVTHRTHGATTKQNRNHRRSRVAELPQATTKLLPNCYHTALGRYGAVDQDNWTLKILVYASRAVQFHPHGVNPISSGPPHVRPMWALSTCGEPDEIKKNTQPKNITLFSTEKFYALFGDLGPSSSRPCSSSSTRTPSPRRRTWGRRRATRPGTRHSSTASLSAWTTPSCERPRGRGEQDEGIIF